MAEDIIINPKKFKDKDLQDTYEVYCTIESRHLERALHSNESMSIAFRRGYFNMGLKGVHNYAKNSHAYAAYLAGLHRGTARDLGVDMVYKLHPVGTRVEAAYGPGTVVEHRIHNKHTKNNGHTLIYSVKFDSGEQFPYTHGEVKPI